MLDLSRRWFEQGCGAIRQVHVPGEHGVHGIQVPAAFQWSWRYPHLVVVAAFQHHHGHGTGGVSRRRFRVCLRPHRLRVSLHHGPEVLPPLPCYFAFPVRGAIVRWDVDCLGAQLRRGSRPACGAWCRSGLGRWGNECVCRGEVRDPYPLLVRLLVVEPPDPHLDEVVRSWSCRTQMLVAPCGSRAVAKRRSVRMPSKCARSASGRLCEGVLW